MLVSAVLITSKATVEGLVLEPTVTTTGPVPEGAALGTLAIICVLLQLMIDVAVTPLNVSVLVPCVVPKPEPEIVTELPTAPRAGDVPVTTGVVPIVSETLSNVAVSNVELYISPAHVTRPTYTFCAMVTDWLAPI